MDTTKIIKLFVIFDLLLMAVYLVVSFSMESHLPLLLQEYLAQEMESEISTADLVALWVGIPGLLIYFISVAGFLLTKAWAKNLYVFGTVLAFALFPFMGPMVEHALSASIYDLSSLTTGAILALLFFTSSAFNKANQQRPSAGAH